MQLLGVLGTFWHAAIFLLGSHFTNHRFLNEGNGQSNSMRRCIWADSGNGIEGVTASLCLHRETSCNSGFRALNSSAPDSLCYKKTVLMTAREEAGQMASSSGTAPPYGRAENAAH